MKVLIVDSHYPQFLSGAVKSVLPGAGDYQTLLQRILNLRFGTSDFYSRNLSALGHEVQDIIFNCEPLQQMWVKEYDAGFRRKGIQIPRALEKLPYFRRYKQNNSSLQAIALSQIRHFRPDVLFLQDLNLFPREVLQQLRNEGVIRLAVGQIACPLPKWEFLDGLDLILTSFPHYVELFRARGIASEYFRIGFDPIVLEEIESPIRDHACTFIGGISPAHSSRLNLLEKLARNVDISFYGYGSDSVDLNSPIHSLHRGDAWALDMYRSLARSRITVNVHIDIAKNNANNMRLYEATGTGAMLLTDVKDNLHELFEIGKEIVVYQNVDDAIDKIRYYTSHPSEATAIAYAGQVRTLKEHTYANRMLELDEILTRYLGF